jgi:hypothetical protein
VSYSQMEDGVGIFHDRGIAGFAPHFAQALLEPGIAINALPSFQGSLHLFFWNNFMSCCIESKTSMTLLRVLVLDQKIC